MAGKLWEKLFVGSVSVRKTGIFGLVALAFVVLVIALIAQSYGLLPNFNEGGLDGAGSGDGGYYPIDVNATGVQFTGWELTTWLSVKERVVVNNTDPDFPDPDNRILGWYSMRNSSSNDYYQKSMEWLMFWEGQGANGEWEAVVSIYNVPNSTSEFVVEVSRFTWNSLDVLLDGEVVVSFPEVEEDTVSLGYTTFQVSV